MTKYFLLLCFLILISCQDTANFEFLLGKWERTNNANNEQTFEFWEKHSKNEYHGLGYTLAFNDTIFKETIRLHKPKNKWIFEVQGVNEKPTLFTLITHTSNHFVCENTKNPFPKQIHYSLENNKTLKAIIADDSTSIPFIFKKLP